jgi:hypothetical protein
MAALPAHVAESMWLAMPDKRVWLEDVEVKCGGRTTYLSVEVIFRYSADGYPSIRTVLYDGKPITMLPAMVDLFEQVLKDEQL